MMSCTIRIARGRLKNGGVFVSIDVLLPEQIAASHLSKSSSPKVPTRIP
jgi:hypothetical protein